MKFDYSKLLGRIKECGFTQGRLAERIGCNSSTLSVKLNNKFDFTMKEIEAICEALDIPRDEIGDYFFCQKSSEKLNK